MDAPTTPGAFNGVPRAISARPMRSLRALGADEPRQPVRACRVNRGCAQIGPAAQRRFTRPDRMARVSEKRGESSPFAEVNSVVAAGPARVTVTPEEPHPRD